MSHRRYGSGARDAVIKQRLPASEVQRWHAREEKALRKIWEDWRKDDAELGPRLAAHMIHIPLPAIGCRQVSIHDTPQFQTAPTTLASWRTLPKRSARSMRNGFWKTTPIAGAFEPTGAPGYVLTTNHIVPCPACALGHVPICTFVRLLHPTAHLKSLRWQAWMPLLMELAKRLG